MNKYLASLIAGIFLSIISFAQNTQTGMHHGGNFSQTKDGTVSGTVIDSVSNKPIAGATIFLYNELRDSATQSIKEMLAGSAITKSDGSFEIGNVPTPARIRAQVSFIGYIAYNKTVMVSPRSNNTASIGNALMQQETGNLQTVNVTASQPFMQMGVDRKIFNVAQSLVSSGQTAQEVMAQIPSVSVDIDGNVSVRGASPQIYVDGMPTTLTLDQIPSDIIDKVELITNPSAKYDASSGGGGIINIVLKKNSTKGYNGGLNGGSDTRGAYNFGGDINMRLGKFNVFARANYRERNSTEKNHSQRDLYNNGIPTDTSIYQSGNSLRKGSFTFLNLGTDYNINKYNVITVSGNYVKGTFSGNQPQTVDSSFNGSPYSRSILGSNSNFEFKNFQGEVKYKHNFSEDGNHNILLDVNYNRATSNNYTAIGTGVYRNAPNFDALENDQLRNTKGNGGNKNWVFQADYTNPITENTKIEAGFRGQIRNTNSNSYQYLANSATEFPDGFDIIDPQYLNALGSSQYSYKDQVYAAYGTFSSKIGEKLSYELGGRIESSNYKGIYDSVPSLHAAPEFKVKYAAEFFPSAFVTYTFTQGEDLQANYSRKVNRPNFFQLLPVYNVSDPYNIEVGNPNLKPEFTSMYELSYDKTYGSGGSFLASTYYRHASNLIVSNQYKSIVNNDTVLVNTYENATSSQTYGLELTNKITIEKIWDLTLNANLYNSVIKGGDSLNNDAENQRVSWFGKWSNTVRLPWKLTFQLSGQYNSKAVLPSSGPSQGGGGGNGGPGLGGNSVGSSQGYIAANYDFDAAIKKDWKWGKGNTLSFTASINDIFGTNKYQSYSVTSFLTQNSYRLRQPRIVRFTLSYRFGRFDKSVFKKKGQQNDNNTDDNGGGMDMGG